MLELLYSDRPDLHVVQPEQRRMHVFMFPEALPARSGVDGNQLDLGLMPVRPRHFLVARQHRCCKRFRQGHIRRVVRRK